MNKDKIRKNIEMRKRHFLGWFGSFAFSAADHVSRSKAVKKLTVFQPK